MHKRQTVSQEQLEREKQVYLYFSALERGDFESAVDIMQRAQSDSLLEKMIMETHAYYAEEENSILPAQVRERIQHLVLQHLPSGIWGIEDDLAIPPLTVGDVVTKLQHDATLPNATRQEIKTVSEQIQDSQRLLPGNLSLKNVSQLFEQLGVSVSLRVQKLFRDTAIFLARGREQGIAQLVATRRQQQRRLQQDHHVSEGESQHNDQ